MNKGRGLLLGVVVALGVSACSGIGLGGFGGSGGTWCYMEASDNGTPVYATPAAGEQPVSASQCQTLASDLSSQLGDYTFKVKSSIPNRLPAPACEGGLDGVGAGLLSTAPSIDTDMCTALGWYPPFAFMDEKLGLENASQVAATLYGSGTSTTAELTGVYPIDPSTGEYNSPASFFTGLARQNYLGGGGFNGQSFDQKALNASFTTGRGSSWVNLQEWGFSPSQIQAYQWAITQANQAAIKGGTSFENVLAVTSQAEYGSESGVATASTQLKKWGVSLSIHL
jgi:hypothetical protein